jgi:hypothetical protein
VFGDLLVCVHSRDRDKRTVCSLKKLGPSGAAPASPMPGPDLVEDDQADDEVDPSA